MNWDWQNTEVINANERFRSSLKIEPKIDEIISRVVGKKIYQCDPRVLKLLCKWKRNKPESSMEADNFLQDPLKVKELKEVLNSNL